MPILQIQTSKNRTVAEVLSMLSYVVYFNSILHRCED